MDDTEILAKIRELQAEREVVQEQWETLNEQCLRVAAEERRIGVEISVLARELNLG